MANQKRLFNIFLLVLVCLIHMDVNAQLSSKDSLFLKNAIHNTTQVYYNQIGDQAAKLNGSQYPGYTVSFSDGQPYFKENALSKGSINYDGVYFDNVQLLYDEVQDCVVLQDSTHRIQLVNEKLKSFSLQDAHFERLEKETTASPVIETGFYQVLASGKVNLYKKETKHMIDKFTNSTELAVLFEIQEKYFLLKDSHYYKINNKKSFYSLLDNKNKELIQYTKKAGLSYNKDRDKMLTSVVDFYNSINQ